MKKNFYALSFFILILNFYTNAMTTQTRRLVKKPIPKTYNVPQTKMYTKIYTKPTLRTKFTQYYTQFKQWLWGPSKTIKSINDEANEIVSNMRQKKSGAVEDFDTFLYKQTQEDVNIFLRNLVATKEGISLLNQYIPHIMAQQLKYRKAQNIFKKIVIWIQYDIFTIFQGDLPIDNNFFLIPLTVLASDKIIPTLTRNYGIIHREPRGKQFFALLEEEDPDLYRRIVMQHILYQDKNKLIARE